MANRDYILADPSFRDYSRISKSRSFTFRGLNDLINSPENGAILNLENFKILVNQNVWTEFFIFGIDHYILKSLSDECVHLRLRLLMSYADRIKLNYPYVPILSLNVVDISLHESSSYSKVNEVKLLTDGFKYFVWFHISSINFHYMNDYCCTVQTEGLLSYYFQFDDQCDNGCSAHSFNKNMDNGKGVICECSKLGQVYVIEKLKSNKKSTSLIPFINVLLILIMGLYIIKSRKKFRSLFVYYFSLFLLSYLLINDLVLACIVLVIVVLIKSYVVSKKAAIKLKLHNHRIFSSKCSACKSIQDKKHLNAFLKFILISNNLINTY